MSNSKKRRRGRIRGDPRPKYTVYSDGSANGMGGAGYVAMIYHNNTYVCYCAGSQPHDELVTNNQAELMAIQLAIYELAEINTPILATFYTDSKYAVNMLFNDFKPKVNKELIKDMRDFIHAIESNDSVIKIQHVPRTEKHIQICDKYANICRKKGEFSLVTRQV